MLIKLIMARLAAAIPRAPPAAAMLLLPLLKSPLFGSEVRNWEDVEGEGAVIYARPRSVGMVRVPRTKIANAEKNHQANAFVSMLQNLDFPRYEIMGLFISPTYSASLETGGSEN